MSDVKKVLLVMPHMIGGGAERVGSLLMNEFAGKGYETEVVLTSDRREDVVRCDLKEDTDLTLLREVMPPETTRDKIKFDVMLKIYAQILCNLFELFHLPVPADLAKASIFVQYRREISWLREKLRKEPHAAVIAFLQPAIPIVMLAARGLPNRVIFSERGDPERLMKKRYGRKFIEKYYARADAAVFQTDAAKAVYPAWLAEKGVVIPNPLKPGLPFPHTGRRRKRVVAYCRISPEKNLPLLIRAFAAFHKNHPDYSLVIFGDAADNDEGRKAACEAEALIRELGLENCAELKPFRPDVHSEIVGDAMYVNSSDREGLSNAMLEAMAIGLPCICTDCPVGGARATIRDGENGLLVPVGNVEKMSEAMARVADDESMRERFSLNGARLRETLSLRVVGDRWEKLFTGCGAEKKELLIAVHRLSVGGVQKSLLSALKVLDYDIFNVTLYVRRNQCQLLKQIDPRVGRIIVNKDTTHYYRRPYAVLLLSMIKAGALIGKKSSVLQERLNSYIRDRRMAYEKKHYFSDGIRYDAAVAYIQGETALFVDRFVQAGRKIVFWHSSVDEKHQLHESVFPSFDRIAAVNDGCREMLRKNYPDSADKIVVVENYVDAEKIISASEEYTVDRPAGKTILCTCGRFSREKGFDLALDAARILKDKGLDFLWYFVGDGPERNALEEKIVLYGLQKEICITGMIENPYPYFASCDIYVQPSYEEAQPLAILEALIFGKTIVSTETVGGKTILENGRRGILTPINAGGLAAGIAGSSENRNTQPPQRIDYRQKKLDYQRHWEQLLSFDKEAGK